MHRYQQSARALGVVELISLVAACGGDKDDDNDTSPVAETPPVAQPAAVQVAFMPDIHFHDVYADFKDGSFPGIPNPKRGDNATIRTMYAQLTSTRLFNENYFAFLAALDDAVARGVKYIALPGDFSDDGQPVHMRGLVKIMDDYTRKHGIQFFAAPGNHDPVRPFNQANGKSDYLGLDPTTGAIGFSQPIYSRGGNAACSTPYAGDWARVGDTYCTEEVLHMGYAGITEALTQHGFMPKPEYLYYETPYSSYKYEDYNYNTALSQASWINRQYEICAQGTGGPNKPANYTFCKMVPDTSYVVEPVKGVWLVGIDANVYVPTGNGANDFTGSGDQGYNKMLTHKAHVIKWLADVVARGKAQGKQVVAFSHFPMTEFFNGASDDIEALLGANKMQMVRRPAENTTRALADTGLKVHVGGHMHFNDTASRNYGGDKALFNIQAPSMAAYVPAYKLMTMQGPDQIELQTIRLDKVPRFDELFDLYRAEHAYTVPPRWDVSILDAKDYGDFNYRYMSELVRLRLLNDDWRCEMRELVKSPLTGADLLVLSQLRTSVTLGEPQNTGDRAQLTHEFFNCLYVAGGPTASNPAFAGDMADATTRAQALAQANGMQLADFAKWKALDMAGDFVRLANAGDLAYADIPAQRASQYKLLAQALSQTNASMQMNGDRVSDANTPADMFKARFKPLMAIMLKLADGLPSEHIRLDLKTNSLVNLSTTPSPF
ncbi:metallophosphoesterase [Achromobacter ruhlandii]|uniref:metallophosphoesterase n=1 Tax=Achromobacter ruhlandii TaxID=72557 RepID=UPI0007BF69DC|nr:metallophosphoesterase [Achromobacter ruhlandii]